MISLFKLIPSITDQLLIVLQTGVSLNHRVTGWSFSLGNPAELDDRESHSLFTTWHTLLRFTIRTEC